MNKKISTNISAFIFAYTLSSVAIGKEVNLKIEIQGQGQISVVGSEQSCHKSCNLTVDVQQEQPIVLQQKASDGSQFTQWLGGSCDGGDGAIISYAPNYITSTLKGAKTLILDDAVNYPSAMDSVDWDFDGDNDLLIVAHGSADILVYLNDGKANFILGQTIKIAEINPYAIAVNDINSDGKLDLLISSFDADIKGNLVKLVDTITNTDLSWFTQNSTNEFEHYQTLSTKEGVITLDTGDIDSDGDIDVAAASITSDQAIIYWNDNKTVIAQNIVNSYGVYGIALGDLDNNGLLDLLVASYWDEKHEFTLQSSARIFTPPKLVKTFNNGVNATALADIDSDGRLDIAAAAFSDNFFIWLKNNSPESCLISNLSDKTVTAVFRSTEQVSSDKDEARALLSKMIRKSRLEQFEQLKMELVNNEPDGAKQWFSFLYVGDYKKTCEISGVDIDKSNKYKLQCQKKMAGLAENLGKKVSHKFIGSQFVSHPANQQGELTTVYYLSEFEGGTGIVILKVTLKNVKGSWRVFEFTTV